LFLKLAQLVSISCKLPADIFEFWTTLYSHPCYFNIKIINQSISQFI